MECHEVYISPVLARLAHLLKPSSTLRLVPTKSCQVVEGDKFFIGTTSPGPDTVWELSLQKTFFCVFLGRCTKQGGKAQPM
jgi:hypothetical protein